MWNGLKDVVILLFESFQITNVSTGDLQLEGVTFT